MKNISLTLFLLSIGSILGAQDLKADMNASAEVFNNLKNYSGKIENFAFYEDAPNVSVLTNTVLLYRSNDNYRYEVDGVITLINSKELLSVNPASKFISYQRMQGHKTNSVDQSMNQFEFLDRLYEVKFKGIYEGQKCYTAKIYDVNITQIELYISTEKFAVTKVIYHYEDPDEYTPLRIEQHHSRNTQIAQDALFDQSAFVSIAENRIIPQGKYKDFQIIN